MWWCHKYECMSQGLIYAFCICVSHKDRGSFSTFVRVCVSLSLPLNTYISSHLHSYILAYIHIHPDVLAWKQNTDTQPVPHAFGRHRWAARDVAPQTLAFGSAHVGLQVGHRRYDLCRVYVPCNASIHHVICISLCVTHDTTCHLHVLVCVFVVNILLALKKSHRKVLFSLAWLPGRILCGSYIYDTFPPTV